MFTRGDEWTAMTYLRCQQSRYVQCTYRACLHRIATEADCLITAGHSILGGHTIDTFQLVSACEASQPKSIHTQSHKSTMDYDYVPALLKEYPPVATLAFASPITVYRLERRKNFGCEVY